jgi:protein phosphatase
MIIIESAGLTDVGKKRKGNEDAFLIDETNQLYVVSDGMGGHLAGEVASNIVVETFSHSMKDGRMESSEIIDETLSSDANIVLNCIHAANKTVFQESRKNEECRGMGATVSAIYCTDSTLIAANVGDSPIYLVRHGEIELLSVMHTVKAEQDAINPERAKLLDERFHHMLTRAVGVAETIEPDVSETPCFENDIVVFCSDGLSNLVSPEEMGEITTQNSAEAACRLFIDMANERGGDDNITVIVLKIKNVLKKKGFLISLYTKIKSYLKNFM